MNKKHKSFWSFFLLILLTALFFGGCAMDFQEAADGQDAPHAPDAATAAEAALRAHDVERARRLYAEHLDQYPENGLASAGLAITDLMLVIGMDEVTELLIENLDASRGINANDILYAEGGYLYWASRGARWEDDGNYQGMKRLLANKLPWSEERLRSGANFVEGLDESVDKLARKLVVLANALKGVDLNLQAAIDDPDFVRIYIPGQVFHDSELTLVLGRSELSALRSAVALFRSAVYFLAAYEHSWNLQQAFGHWRYEVALDHDRYVPGFEAPDYTVNYLDEHLFRRIAAPERLSASRKALRHALQQGRDAIRFGLEETSSTTLKWDNVSVEEARMFDEFFAAMSASLDGKTDIPHTDPPLSIDLSSFFSTGRVLAAEIPWFVQYVEAPRSGTAPGDEEFTYWALNEEASGAFVFEDVFSGPVENGVIDAISPGRGGLSGLIDSVFGDYLDAVHDVYFSTR